MSEKKHNPGFKLTPAEAAAKMVSKVAAAPGVWAEGIELTKVDIIERARSDEAEKNFAAAMQKVIAEKSRQKGLAEITTAELKRIVREKSGNWAAGVAAKEEKIKRRVAAAIAVTYEVAEEVGKMPRGLPGSAERKNRMIKYFDLRVEAKKTRGT